MQKWGLLKNASYQKLTVSITTRNNYKLFLVLSIAGTGMAKKVHRFSPNNFLIQQHNEIWRCIKKDRILQLVLTSPGF